MDTRLPIAFWFRLVFAIFLVAAFIVFATQRRWIEAALAGGVAVLMLFNASFLFVGVRRALLPDD